MIYVARKLSARSAFTPFVITLTLFAALPLAGCSRKEKVIDIKTPRRTIEVERDKDTGDVKVDIERKEKE